MKRLIQSIGLILCCLFSQNLQANETNFEGWTHLELGSGNYGQRTRTKKWIPKKTPDLTEMDLYIALLDEDNWGQYGVLYWTLDELIDRYGLKGVFHVNDRTAPVANYTASMLQKYADKQGYDQVIIEPMVGDYKNLNPQKCLTKFGLKKYDSVHLKNPEPSLYRKTLPSDRVATRRLFQRLANLSHEGFFLFFYRFNTYIPKIEIEEFFKKGIFYLPTEEWQPVPYVSTGGNITSQTLGKVVFIRSTQQDSDSDQE